MMEAAGWPRPALQVIESRGFRSNTYLLATGQAPECVVIDPGLDRDAIEKAIATSGWRPTSVLCTHGHFDHIGNAAWLQTTYSIPVYLRQPDLKVAKLANFMLTAFKINQRIELPVFQLLEDEDTAIDCGGSSFFFHAMPGHTPGSAAIAVDDLLFSGDSLYAKKIALSRLPGEDHGMLRASLSRLFGSVAGSVRVLPGHGGSATLDEIQRGNLELRAFMAQQD